MYIIKTENLNYYLCNDNMDLCTLNHNKPYNQHDFSGKWKLKGFSKILAFRKLGILEDITSVLNKDMKFKNGKGAYVLHDLDHNTHRTWGERITAVWETPAA